MIKKHLAVFGLVLGLFVMFANPALANELTSATAVADCTGYTLSVNATDLSVGTTYTVSYTFTLTPTAGGAPITVGPFTFMFMATSVTQTGITAPLPPGATEIPWPAGTLLTNYTVTGSATLTALNLPVPITINGSTSVTLACGIQERMTGGGSVTVDLTGAMQVTVNGDPIKVTHGFEIHCNPPNHNDSLEINWPGPHHFHLETLTLGTCVCNSHLLPPEHPDAGFNEFIGAGTGKLDGTTGASIVFDFTDQGEPGTNDTESMTIFDSSGSPVLSFPTTNITFGNQQAHRQGSGKVPPCNPPGS